MKKLTKLFVFTIIVTFCIDTNSQIGITSYSIYALGINTSQNRIISAELKTFANRDIDDLLMEADVFFNFKPGNYHRFSVGVGINIGPFQEGDLIYALTVPLEIEIYPFQNFKKISLLFELTPEITGDNNLNLRNLWGIRYTFGEKE